MKKVLLGLLVLLCLAVIALLVLPGFINWNDHRGWVERRLTGYVGRDVNIAGDIDLSLLPTPILTASDVTLRDNQGGSLAEIEAVDVRAGLIGLLGGRLDIERLVLIGADIYLSPGAIDLAPLAGEQGLAESVALSRVTVEGGSVYWSASGGEPRQIADEIFAQMTAESLAGPFNLVSSVRLMGQNMALDLDTGDLSSGGAWPISLETRLDGSDTEIRYSGLIGLDGRLQGDLEADGSNASRPMFNVAPHWVLPAEWAAPFALETRVSGGLDGLTFDNLGLQIGEVRATGEASLALDDVPSLAVDATLSRLDLTNWLNAAGETVPPPGAETVAGRRPLALPQGLALSLGAHVGAVVVGEGPIRNVRLETLLSDGVLSVSRFTAQLPGGTDVRGVGTLTTDQGAPIVDLGVEVASGDMRRLLGWLGVDTQGIPTTRLRAFTGRANLRGSPSDFSVGGLDLMLDSTQVSGGLAWRDSDRLGLGMRLSVDALNLDSYWPDIPDDPAAALAELADWADTRWPLLLTFDANVDIAVGRLTVAGSRLDDTAIDATLAQGALTVRHAAIGSWEGAALSAEGQLASVWPPAGIDAAASLSTADPAGLAERVGLTIEWPLRRLGEVSVSARLVGNAENADLEAGGQLAGGELLLGGSVADPLGTPTYDIAARLTHDDALAVANLIWPDYRPAGDLGAVDLFARLVGPPDRPRLEEIIGQIGQTTVGGVVDVDLSGQRPALAVELSASQFPLDDLLPARQPDFIAPGASRWPTDPFRAVDLGAVDARLRMTAGDLTVLGQRILDPSFDLALDQGTVTLEALSGRIFGGQIAASGSWRPDARTEVSVDLALADADLAGALGTGLGIEGVSGRLDGEVAVSGAGTSLADLISRLVGEGLIAAREGVAEGLDLAAASDQLGTLDGPLEFLGVLRGPLSNGTTAYDALNIPFVIAGGAAESTAIRWRTEAGLGRGEARFDLARLQLEAILNIGFFDYPGAPPFGLRVFGPLGRLDRRLQADALQAWVAQRAAEALTDRLQPAPQDEAPPGSPDPGAGTDPGTDTDSGTVAPGDAAADAVAQ